MRVYVKYKQIDEHNNKYSKTYEMKMKRNAKSKGNETHEKMERQEGWKHTARTRTPNSENNGVSKKMISVNSLDQQRVRGSSVGVIRDRRINENLRQYCA